MKTLRKILIAAVLLPCLLLCACKTKNEVNDSSSTETIIITEVEEKPETTESTPKTEDKKEESKPTESSKPTASKPSSKPTTSKEDETVNLEATVTESGGKKDWRSHPEDYKLVAFTFDDAPSYTDAGDNITTRIIDLLNKYDGAGTLFVTGGAIRENGTKLLKYAVKNGFEIGNHTDNHKYLTQISRDEVKKEIVAVNDILKKEMNYTTKYVRPGYVAVNDTVFDVCTELNMPVIGEGLFDELGNLVMLGDWSGDAATYNKDTIYNNCMKYAEDGSIILLHGWSNMTDQALVKLIPDMYVNGYRFVTLSELFKYHEITKVPTTSLIQCTSKLGHKPKK